MSHKIILRSVIVDFIPSTDSQAGVTLPLYEHTELYTPNIGVMEHGPAIQLGVETVKLLDRQAGVDLISIGPDGGTDQVRQSRMHVVCPA